MTRLLTFFILICILVGEAHSTNIGYSYSGEEEFKVYQSLLDEESINNRTRLLVLIDHTVATTFVSKELDRDDIRSFLSPISQSTIDAFKRNNKEPQTLSGRFKPKGEFQFLDENEFLKLFKENVMGGWDEFYKRYPESAGFVRLSSVGFNSEGTQALVYVEHGCGATCGTGTYVLLTKVDERWRVSRKALHWVS